MQSQSQMKYIDYVLPEQINSKYTCTICSDIVKYPTQLPCNHLFCLPCVERWVRENGSCPTCRAKVDKKIRLKVNQQVEIEVENLMIYCPHHPERCTWKGLRKDYEDHKKVCTYHLIPKDLVKPLGRNDANFEEKRHMDPGSLMARILSGASEVEKQLHSNMFQYMADCKKKEGEGGNNKLIIKRAGQKLAQRTSELKKNYPDYFQEKKQEKEKRISDQQETEQVQGNIQQRQSNKGEGVNRKPRQQKIRGSKELQELDAKIAECINMTKNGIRYSQRGRNSRYQNDDEQDNSDSGLNNMSMLQFQANNQRHEG